MRALSAMVAVSACSLVGAVQAAPVTLCGPGVCYEYDNAQAAVPFFGLPTLVGNDIIFTPATFRADAADGGNDAVSATFQFDRVYTTTPGDEILNITAYEDGDYRIIQGGSVSGDLYLRAISLVALEDDLDIDSVDFFGDSGGLQLWSMSAAVNPAAVFTAVANDMRLTIQNDLAAFTTAVGDRAWIEKKLVLTITTLVPSTPVPVPAALWLFGSALGLLGWVRRARGQG